MNTDFEVTTRSASAEDVLQVFQDWHRQECAFYHMGPQIALSFDSTLTDWCGACDLMDPPDWKRLANEMNEQWNVNISMSEWKACLKPARKHRLGEVCKLIARHAQLPAIRPLRILDRDCLPGGAFLTVMAMLKNAGADVDSIGPSTLLSEYSTHYCSVFLGPVSRLAPGVMPAIEADLPNLDINLGISGMLMWFGAIIFWNQLPFSIIAMLAVAGILIWGYVMCIEAWKPPKSVAFGKLKTFKDLAMLLAEDTRGTLQLGSA